ncbi:hypothetical protein D1007_53498 [Hordeum vulgare]|nr:hypothetical protein D1007_53498 [Hordeum vulgare]
MPTFAITVVRAPKKFFKDVDKARQRFLSAQDDAISRGKCKVNWQAVTRTKRAGGLGIHGLPAFSSALRLRWLWLAWTQLARPWVGMGTLCNAVDHALFASCMEVTIGDGATASFSTSSWLGGTQLCLAYPVIFGQSIRKNRSVREALHRDRWILDLRHGDYESIMHLVLHLAQEIRSAGIILEEGRADTISWTPCSLGKYTARSAYDAMFDDNPALNFKTSICRVSAPGKMKMLLWLLHLGRLRYNDRLQRRGRDNKYFASFVCGTSRFHRTSSRSAQ